jgi:hypothetical protein
VGVQTQFSKTADQSCIDSLEQDYQDLKNEYEIKESQMQLEIHMLKAKLEEQVQINLGTKKILSLENKSLDLLNKKVENYLERENYTDIDGLETSVKLPPEELEFTRTGTEISSNILSDKKYKPSSKDHDISCISESAISVGSKSDSASNEFESKYSKLKTTIELLLKINKKLKTKLQDKTRPRFESSGHIKPHMVTQEITIETGSGYAS